MGCGKYILLFARFNMWCECVIYLYFSYISLRKLLMFSLTSSIIMINLILNLYRALCCVWMSNNCFGERTVLWSCHVVLVSISKVSMLASHHQLFSGVNLSCWLWLRFDHPTGLLAHTSIDLFFLQDSGKVSSALMCIGLLATVIQLVFLPETRNILPWL